MRRVRPKPLRLALAERPRLRTRLTLSRYISVTLREKVSSLKSLLELREEEQSAREKPLV